MRTKICGITRIDDAEAAARAGAWAIGLNFWEGSARRIDEAVAEEIGVAIKRHSEIVGVFVNPALDRVSEIAERVGLTMLQFHGDEGPAFCAEAARRTGCRTIKAFRVRSGAEVRGAAAWRTDLHLFDAFRPGQPGGTGQSFDWELIADRRGEIPAILAGGLTPENVAEAIVASNDPWAVDVAGGVEAGTPGIKDHERIHRFIAAANETAVQRAGT